MRKKNLLPILITLIAVSMILLVSCGSNEAENVPNEPVVEENTAEPVVVEDPVVEEPVVELFGDSLRGGLLYDKWWVPLGLDAPTEDQPIWATQTNNTRSGADTWRCKECHGWDYKGAEGAYAPGSSHNTGFIGLIQLSGTPAVDILAMLKGSTNADHDLSVVMDDQALTDIALFLSEELLDYSELVGDDDKVALLSDAGGETLYQDTCSECHGPEGLAINFGKKVTKLDYVSAIANGNPWEFLHKARFGQPGSEMPSVIDFGWSLDEQGALLAYAQTLASDSPATEGGRMWDKWWKALGTDAPEGDMPLWATQTNNTRSGEDTWRCKECHGWDYKGVDGAYADSSHTTGFAGVFGSDVDFAGWLDGTENADHDFSAYMDESAIAQMVAFLSEGLIDMSIYINYDDKTVTGDVAAGQALFDLGCSRCHGDDGKAINFGDDDSPVYLGDVAASNPWETLHKAANGQPGTAMPSGLNFGWTWQDLADVVAYVMTLID